MKPLRRLTVRVEQWPVAGRFAIARGVVRDVSLVTATLTQGSVTGWGECVPYARYGESVHGVCAALEALRGDIANGLDREGLLRRLAPGAARNALDAALWDFEAKQAGRPVWELAGLSAPHPLSTAYTLSLDAPASMGLAARHAADRPLLKIKLGGGGDDDLARLRAVRLHAPRARLLVDANEGWPIERLPKLLEACALAEVAMVEQPLPADADASLAELQSPVPLCADESAHGLDTLDGLMGKYAAVNIKLDKTGGLTEALRVREAARARGLHIMVGCMLATSLSMAPAMLAAQTAEVVDLDGPLLLARDREPPIQYQGSRMYPPPRALWG